jgi:hypothetical protein
MDFVSAWKAISIGFTGLFGLMGLLTENKDKDTGKLTKWGMVSLIGIVLSTTLGVSAQLKETSDEGRRREAAAAETIKLLQQTGAAVSDTQRLLAKTDLAVVDIRRLLSPLEISSITFEMIGSCVREEFEKFCKDIKDDSPEMNHRRDFPGPDYLTFNMAFYNRSIVNPTVLNGQFFPEQDFVVQVSGSFDSKDHKLLYGLLNDRRFQIVGLTLPPGYSGRSANILSIDDLDGATLLVMPFEKIISLYEPPNFRLRTKQGREVSIRNGERIDLPDNVAFKYKIDLPKG